MATLNITKENIDATIKDNDIVLLDAWASWCGPCKMFGPTFEESSNKHENIVFGKIDTEAEKELAASFGIRSIPTLIAFREQIPVFMQPGALPTEALEELIGKIEALDMDEVRKEVAKRETETAQEGQKAVAEEIKKNALETEIAELSRQIEDAEKRLPAHSIRPHQLLEIEELEDQLIKKKTELKKLDLTGQSPFTFSANSRPLILGMTASVGSRSI